LEGREKEGEVAFDIARPAVIIRQRTTSFLLQENRNMPIHKIDLKGKGVEGYGRSGYFKAADAEVYIDEREASVHVRSSRSRWNSPILVKGPLTAVRSLVRRLNALLEEAHLRNEPLEDAPEGLQSSADYAEAAGSDCPVCGECHTLSADLPELDCATVIRGVACSNCGSSWTEIYDLVAYANLKVGEKARV